MSDVQFDLCKTYVVRMQQMRMRNKNKSNLLSRGTFCKGMWRSTKRQNTTRFYKYEVFFMKSKIRTAYMIRILFNVHMLAGWLYQKITNHNFSIYIYIRHAETVQSAQWFDFIFVSLIFCANHEILMSMKSCRRQWWGTQYFSDEPLKGNCLG